MKKNTPQSEQCGTKHKITPLTSTQGKKSIKSIEDVTTFDTGRIIDHYHTLKEQQHQQLARINLSEELKRELFGFSNSAYIPPINHDQLVIENHPIKGRTIMSTEKYEFHKEQK